MRLRVHAQVVKFLCLVPPEKQELRFGSLGDPRREVLNQDKGWHPHFPMHQVKGNLMRT